MTVNTMFNLVNFRAGLIAALQEDGHEIIALAPFEGNESRVAALGCETVHLKMDNKGISPRRDIALIARMYSNFRRLKPDAVLSYTIKNNIYGAFAARAAGIPFFPNVTGLGTAFLSGSLLQRVAETLYRRSFASARQVFFQNGDDAALFLSRGLVREDQVTCLPGSGIDLGRFPASPLPNVPGKPVFLMISRPLRDKGFAEYVEAARGLKATHPGADCRVLGPMGYENRSALPVSDVQDWINAGTITHLGEITDVRPAIAAADCVVLPSYREGLPRSLLEGAAMGRPLITTDVPGCRDLLDKGQNGFLCEVRNAADLLRKMQAMANLSASERQTMGDASRSLAEARFSQDRVIEAYRTALRRI